MLIGELAKALSVTPKTLRHYETIGLVPAAERARNGYRTYSLEAIRRARLVVGLRSLGLTLDTIQSLLADDGRPLRQKLLGVLDQQIQSHALQIVVLQGRHDDLNARYDALLSQLAGAPPDCICGALMRDCDCVPVKPSDGQKSRTAKASVRGG
jgi:DNA-binding transcriptional MerR regulator